jgi:OmpR-family two-component system manganese-sensing response regulator
MRILIIEDDNRIAQPLAEDLRHQNHVVDIAKDGIEGWEYSESTAYDLILLDLMLPKLDGITLCKKLRNAHVNIPILMLTAKDTISDKVMGLDAGADDYLVKPFELRELLARVRALLRRSPNFEVTLTQRLKFADLELDLDNQVAYRQGRVINLSEKENQLLAYLIKSPGQLLTHEQIYQHLWTETESPNSNVLAALMRLLRRKIEAPKEQILIHTVYGKGYRFGDFNSG